MPKFFTMRNMFSLFLIIWFAYGVWEARSYAYLARIFPFYVSLVLLICAIINLIKENLPKSRSGKTASGGSDLNSQWDVPMIEVWRSFLFYVGFILLIYILIYAIGYPLAITLFIFFFYRQIARASYPVAIIASAAGLGFLSIASKALHMSWPEGLFKLPWPLG